MLRLRDCLLRPGGPQGDEMIGVIDPQATQATRARCNRIAPFYDRMGKLSERRFRPWREILWAAVPAGRVLEVGWALARTLLGARSA